MYHVEVLKLYQPSSKYLASRARGAKEKDWQIEIPTARAGYPSEVLTDLACQSRERNHCVWETTHGELRSIECDGHPTRPGINPILFQEMGDLDTR